MRVWGRGDRVADSDFRVLGFKVERLRFKGWGLWFGVEGFGFRVEG